MSKVRRPVILTVEHTRSDQPSGCPVVTGMREMTRGEHLWFKFKNRFKRKQEVQPSDPLVDTFNVGIQISTGLWLGLVGGDPRAAGALRAVNGIMHLVPPPNSQTPAHDPEAYNV